MFDVSRFIDKIKKWIPIDEVLGTLEKLPNDPTFNQISENSGTIGGIVKIALHITEKIYQVKVPVDKRLSLTLMRIMIESAKDSIPYSVANAKVDSLFSREDSEAFEDIVLKLFDRQTATDENTIDYLPDHPVFVKFRNLLRDGIEKYNQEYVAAVSIPRFLTEFNSNLLLNLEAEKSTNRDLQGLLQKWELDVDFEKLSGYLNNARKIFFERNSVDHKSLSEYYVENQTYVVDKKSWDSEEDAIERKREWDLHSFLIGDELIAIIAAPFGIGKSSLAKKMSHDIASQFIEDPTAPHAYIPIFVPLKSALEITCNNNSLENDLKSITSYSSRKEKANILVILDGLDELPEDRPVNLHNIYTQILALKGSCPNCKFIITTRLEAGFPSRLNIKESYIRLFSFNENQINEFFSNYDLAIDYRSLKNILSTQKLGKALFCWMIATVYNKSSENEKGILFGTEKKEYLSEIFLYQQFIHNVILGKPKDIAIAEFEEWYKRSRDEKQALRLIAFLKNDRSNIAKEKIEGYLEDLEFNLPKSAAALLSTYFSITIDDQGKGKLEFTHKSFQEYLLAEFYLESILNKKYHRLIGNDPSKETYNFMNSFIRLLTDTDSRILNYSKDFIKSFSFSVSNQITDEIELDDFVRTLKFSACEYVKQKDLLPYIPQKETIIWNFTRLEYGHLRKLWVSRWISLYVAGNLANEQDSRDNDFFDSASSLIRECSMLIHTKDLSSVALLGLNLDNGYFRDAIFSDSNLSHAKLRNTLFVESNLSNADLSNADLSNSGLLGSDFSYANFSGADLSASGLLGSDFSYANFSGADFSNATVMSGTDFSDANFSDANLSGATMSNETDLSGANLSGANLSGANLSDADLSDADLSDANLSKSFFTNVNLSNAVLDGADLSGAVFTKVNFAEANLSAANLSTAAIIRPTSFESSKIDSDTNFTESVTDDKACIQYIVAEGQTPPTLLKDKQELGDTLRVMHTDFIPSPQFQSILNYTSLPGNYIEKYYS